MSKSPGPRLLLPYSSSMSYKISDLEQGDATLWKWLAEAIGEDTEKDASALAAMAGIGPFQAGAASLALEDCNKLYYLYMLIHEMQQRLHPAIVPTALGWPL